VRAENYSVVTAVTPALFNGGQMSCMMRRGKRLAMGRPSA
jgi:hypothetical protein